VPLFPSEICHALYAGSHSNCLVPRSLSAVCGRAGMREYIVPARISVHLWWVCAAVAQLFFCTIFCKVRGRRSGGIGRRKGLKIPRGQPHTGSIPVSGTTSIGELESGREMRTYILWIAVVGLFLPSCRAKETQWILIKDDPSLNLSVEKNSIERVSRDLVRAWVTFEFKAPKATRYKTIRKALSHDEIDCAKRTLRIMKATFYFTDGTSRSLPEKLAVAGITPGSPGEFEYNYLCKKQ
jgi:Surface-adhesin protein E